MNCIVYFCGYILGILERLNIPVSRVEPDESENQSSQCSRSLTSAQTAQLRQAAEQVVGSIAASYPNEDAPPSTDQSASSASEDSSLTDSDR